MDMRMRFRFMVAAFGLFGAMACSTFTRAVAPAPTPLPTLDPHARQVEAFEAAWEAVRDEYVRSDYDGVDWEAVGEEYRGRLTPGLDHAAFATLMREMLAELPADKAAYQTRAEWLEEAVRETNLYYGVGAFISFRETPEPHVVILSIIAASPAEKAGLQAHDSIYAIDGVPVQPNEGATVAQRIRGAPDTSVTLTVQSPGGSRRDITIPRGQINAVDDLIGRYVPSLGVAYYRLPVTADADTVNAIASDLSSRSNDQVLNGIILDLRVARSGSSRWPLRELLTLFGNGTVGEFHDRTAVTPMEITGQDVAGSQAAPLVLLIGPDTQGPAEILAGALRSTDNAILVGLPTPGSIEGSQEFTLPDGARMRLATSSFRTPDGIDLAVTGLQPDILVSEDWDAVTNDQDPALSTAVALLLSN